MKVEFALEFGAVDNRGRYRSFEVGNAKESEDVQTMLAGAGRAVRVVTYRTKRQAGHALAV